MLRAATLFGAALVSVVFANSYALPAGDMLPVEYGTPDFDTGIMMLDPGFFEQAGHDRYVILDSHDAIPGGPFHVAVLPESAIPGLLASDYHIIKDTKLDFYQKTNMDASSIGRITGSLPADEKYGMTGDGITIGIVDTGVDFSNPDIRESLARDELNHPLMLDPDGQGIVITNSTFFAFIDEDGIIRNYSKPIPEEFASSVYHTKEGVFLDISQNGNGTEISVYNSFFPAMGTAPTFNGTLNKDMKIGNDNRDYIRSMSGIYHLGVMYQGILGETNRIQVVPVLVVDSVVPGMYDTVIPDMSTSWEDFMRSDLKDQEPNYDFDFTDENPIVLGSGNEFLLYDSDGDGNADYSAGTIGARVLDIYGVMADGIADTDSMLGAINGTLLAPLDSDGDYFGVMTDFMGHGTSSASSIVSRGEQTYDIYNDTGQHSLRGVAPDAKILPIKAMWFGDAAYSWMWAAGFDNQDGSWIFTGKPRVDIISNSWGVSTFPTYGNAPGTDLLSLLAAALSTPYSIHDDFGGLTVVSSAGNSGHGYGTISLPNSSPFSITVGATTNNVFVGYGPFEGQPRFGNSTIHHNHIVDFSSRGPTIIGDPKPDLVSIGAYGFTPSSMLRTERDSKEEPFSLYGGTSMSAPLVSGSTAILMEGLQSKQESYDAFEIKNILMSTATDLHNDPFTQGAGLSNVEAALDFVHGKEGRFIVYNDASYRNIATVLEPAVSSVAPDMMGLERFGFPNKIIPMTGWFAGKLLPGERSTATFTVENPTNDAIEVRILPQSTAMIKQDSFQGGTEPRQQDQVMNKTGAFSPNYVQLSDVRLYDDLGKFFDGEDQIPPEASLLVLAANFAFDDFMNKTTDTYADDIKISSLYLYDWVDADGDAGITADELSMVSRAGSWGTVQELRVSDPAEQFEGIPLVGIYPVPTRHSYWLGNTQLNSTSMEYTLSASYYQRDRWPVIWANAETLEIPAGGTATVDVSLVAPSDSVTGNYQGFLTFESQDHTVNAPVSFAVTTEVADAGQLTIPGRHSDGMIFANGQVKGAFDMLGRYMAGDWRQYLFDVDDDSIDSGSIEISWQDQDTNLSVFVADPAGRIVHTNVPSGVFGHFLGWPSVDWLGPSPSSQGGGFFPVKNKNDTSTVLLVPINQTGTYTVLAHSTLFGGNSTTEPISLKATFTSMPNDIVETPGDTDTASDNMTKYATAPDVLNRINITPDIFQDTMTFDHTSSDTATPDIFQDIIATPDMPKDTATFEMLGDTISDAQPAEIPESITPNDITADPGMILQADAPTEFSYLLLGIGIGASTGLISAFLIKRRKTTLAQTA